MRFKLKKKRKIMHICVIAIGLIITSFLNSENLLLSYKHKNYNKSTGIIPLFKLIPEDKSHIKVNPDYLYHGIAIVDVNNDGYDDFLVSDMLKPHAYYLNNGNGTFVDKSVDIPFYGYWGHGIVLVDIDNDGDLDLFIANAQKGEPNQFFINDGKGNFTEQTDLLPSEALETRGIAVLDVNNDGLYDIYFVNFYDKNELIINRGNLNFVEMSKEWGCEDNPPNKDGSQGVTAIDYNNDGLTDIYVSRYQFTIPNQKNVLFENKGNSFVNVAGELGVDVEDNNGAVFSDLDNDGWYDLIISSHRNSNPLIIFKNNNGFFEDFSKKLDLDTGTETEFSIITADLNNDGLQDIIVPGHNSYTKVFINLGDFNFKEVKTGLEKYLGDTRAVGVFDYDNDGDLDILFAGKRMGIFFFENHLDPASRSGANYIDVLFKAPTGNIGAIGSSIFLIRQQEEFEKYISFKSDGYSTLQIKGPEAYLSQHSLVQHFGIGGDKSISLKVRFTNGDVKYLLNLSKNKKYFAGFISDVQINLEEYEEESLLFKTHYKHLNLNLTEEMDKILLFVKRKDIDEWIFVKEIKETGKKISIDVSEEIMKNYISGYSEDDYSKFGIELLKNHNAKNVILVSYVYEIEK